MAFPPKAKAKSAAKFDSYPDSKKDGKAAKGAPPAKKPRAAASMIGTALKESY